MTAQCSSEAGDREVAFPDALQTLLVDATFPMVDSLYSSAILRTSEEYAALGRDCGACWNCAVRDTPHHCVCLVHMHICGVVSMPLSNQKGEQLHQPIKKLFEEHPQMLGKCPKALREDGELSALAFSELVAIT